MPRETLVMIPPMLSDARVFAHQVQVMSRAHAVMVAPPTCGERIEEIASQILTWSPSKFALCGMGMGGMVAMELLRRAPDRITRIALLSTSPQADTPEAAAAREPHIIAARAGRWDDVLQHEINSTWIMSRDAYQAQLPYYYSSGDEIGGSGSPGLMAPP